MITSIKMEDAMPKAFLVLDYRNSQLSVSIEREPVEKLKQYYENDQLVAIHTTSGHSFDNAKRNMLMAINIIPTLSWVGNFIKK